MKATNRMQQIRLETQNLTEMVEQNLNGSQSKSNTLGCIKRQVTNLRRDLLLLTEELKNDGQRT